MGKRDDRRILRLQQSRPLRGSSEGIQNRRPNYVQIKSRVGQYGRSSAILLVLIKLTLPLFWPQYIYTYYIYVLNGPNRYCYASKASRHPAPHGPCRLSPLHSFFARPRQVLLGLWQMDGRKCRVDIVQVGALTESTGYTNRKIKKHKTAKEKQ